MNTITIPIRLARGEFSATNGPDFVTDPAWPK